MISLFKMDLYRLFKTKSLYIVWGVLTFLIFFMSYIWFGIDENAGISRLSIIYGMRSTFLFPGIITAVFAVIFATADMNSGYIKNIGGQLKNRSSLIFSKSLALLPFTAITFLLAVLVQMLANRIILGYIEFGKFTHFITFFLAETLLLYALALFCMMISVVIRKTPIAMTISVAIGMGLSTTIIYPAINALAEAIGAKNFDFLYYGLYGNLAAIPQDTVWTDATIPRAVVVAVVFITISTLISCFTFKKRDIV